MKLLAWWLCGFLKKMLFASERPSTKLSWQVACSGLFQIVWCLQQDVHATSVLWSGECWVWTEAMEGIFLCHFSHLHTDWSANNSVHFIPNCSILILLLSSVIQWPSPNSSLLILALVRSACWECISYHFLGRRPARKGLGGQLVLHCRQVPVQQIQCGMRPSSVIVVPTLLCRCHQHINQANSQSSNWPSLRVQKGIDRRVLAWLEACTSPTDSRHTSSMQLVATSSRHSCAAANMLWSSLQSSTPAVYLGTLL